MELTFREECGQRFVEGTRGQSLMRRADDVAQILEACFGSQATRVLLYSENLTEKFFDLSTGDAGAILQAFRNYGVRVAVVCPPSVKFSPKFGQMIAEENRGPYFRTFDDREMAREWLCSD